jgi:hypothetical protein
LSGSFVDRDRFRCSGPYLSGTPGEAVLTGCSAQQRVLLAESLLGSLPPLAEEWSKADEIEDVERREREREIESGRVQPVNKVEFWRRVEARRKR